MGGWLREKPKGSGEWVGAWVCRWVGGEGYGRLAAPAGPPLNDSHPHTLSPSPSFTPLPPPLPHPFPYHSPPSPLGPLFHPSPLTPLPPQTGFDYVNNIIFTVDLCFAVVGYALPLSRMHGAHFQVRLWPAWMPSHGPASRPTNPSPSPLSPSRSFFQSAYGSAIASPRAAAA